MAYERTNERGYPGRGRGQAGRPKRTLPPVWGKRKLFFWNGPSWAFPRETNFSAHERVPWAGAYVQRAFSDLGRFTSGFCAKISGHVGSFSGFQPAPRAVRSRSFAFERFRSLALISLLIFRLWIDHSQVFWKLAPGRTEWESF